MSTSIVYATAPQSAVARPARQRGQRKAQSPKKKGKGKAGKPGQQPKQRMRKRNQTLTNCEALFARAMVNPFDRTVYGRVCAPVYPSRPSQKVVMNYSNYAFQTGTNNFGFVAVDPCVAVDGNAVVNPITVTSSTYTGTDVNPFAQSGTGISTQSLSGPYANADLVSGNLPSDITKKQGRVVCAGWRFRYTGPEMYRGGSVFHAFSTNQTNLSSSGVSPSQFFTPGTRRYPITREWQYVPISPIHPEDWTFVPSNEDSTEQLVVCPWTNGTTPGILSALCFQVASNLGNTFEVEYAQHTEFSGKSISDLLSPSHVGRQQIVDTIHNAARATNDSPNNDVPAPLQMAREVAKSELRAPEKVDLIEEFIDAFSNTHVMHQGAEKLMRIAIQQSFGPH